MFSGQRDFRAVTFCSSLHDVRKVLGLFPKGALSDELGVVGAADGMFVVYHGFYYSTTEYCDADTLKDVAVPFPEGVRYRYDFYVCHWKRGRRGVLVFAVPFSRMAADMFGLLEERGRAYRRQYKKLDLDALVSQLTAGSPLSEEIAATAVRFRVSGGDTVQSATVSGSDVFGSELYQRTQESLHGINLVPRRVRIRYERYPERFTLEADTHGNFWFRVSKDGANIGGLYHLLTALDNANLLQDTVAYPLRPGIRKEDDEL